MSASSCADKFVQEVRTNGHSTSGVLNAVGTHLISVLHLLFWLGTRAN